MSFSFESIAHLDHSREFAQLHQKFHQFNPLKVLRVDQFEIRHSNVLAWLLDPNENHQLGNFFVKKLLSRLVTRVENEDKTDEMDFLTYMHASFSDVEVYREVRTATNRSIDLVVVVPSKKLVLVIENKFHAFESLGQLDDYLTYAKNMYQDFKVIPIFLTLRSDAPTHPEYWVLDYNDVLEIILLHIELNREVMSDNIYDFLMYYTAILQEQLVQDDEDIELALEVYQANKTAIDLLYLSQHNEFRKQPRYHELYQSVDQMTVLQQEGLKRIYDKKEQSIDYVFKIGSNVMREAFLSFAEIEDLPPDVFNAHVQYPSFILPEWLDYPETIGEPESGYWLGHGLIIWFERLWNEQLKVTVEVGPVPYEKRLKLLNAMESEGISFRPSAKIEGKKYTKIYTETTDIPDWANKQEIVKGMETLFHDPALIETFKRIALAVEKMENEEEFEAEQMIPVQQNTFERFPQAAFVRFAKTVGIEPSCYRVGNRNASFLMPVFRELEHTYGVSRHRWWWHDSTFSYWFDRLRDERLKLTLELGPIQPEKRIAMIEKLETMGIPFSNQSKKTESRYTKLFSKAVVMDEWDNEEVLHHEMVNLFEDPKNQAVLAKIQALIEDN
jgi:hypothetical protein